MRQVRAIEKRGVRASIAVGYLALCSESDDAPAPGTRWVSLENLGGLVAHQRAIVAEVGGILRRAGDSELPFALLPRRFTLSALQRASEMLSGRKLYKASFRRTLFAAKLVEATDEWHAEGRGRPARVFRRAGRND